MNPREDIGQNQFGMYTIKIENYLVIIMFHLYFHIYAETARIWIPDIS